MRIAIVGPCASGKSSLARVLRERGLDARQIAQEHSYVPDMWARLTRPDILICLHASFDVCTRRKDLHWTRSEYEEQLDRLRHARQNCHLFLRTDDLSPDEVVRQVWLALGDRLDPGRAV
ncbi:MAG: hypothetical protein ACRDHY_16380 [Anaerolineales bacterium]